MFVRGTGRNYSFPGFIIMYLNSVCGVLIIRIVVCLYLQGVLILLTRNFAKKEAVATAWLIQICACCRKILNLYGPGFFS